MSKKLSKETSYIFVSFYHFTDLNNLPELKESLLSFQKDVLGLVILAREGINGTLAGSEEQIRAMVEYLQSQLMFQGLELKYSRAVLKRMPFRKLKVKIKAEIVTFGQSELATVRGSYVEPEQWNELMLDPQVLVVDVRNVYENRIGTFRGARNPQTLNFQQFPHAIKKIIDQEQPARVAMFCTGGIRCEKAAAYVKQLGIDEVYQLHGGILKYFEDIPAEESLWDGKCFVFDGRITVNQELEAVPEPLCKVCGQVMLKSPDSNEYQCYQCIEYPMNTRV